MKLLRIDSSGRHRSVTRRLTESFAQAWTTAHPDGVVMERNLAATPLPQITDDWSATYGDPAQMSAAQHEYLATSDSLIAELLAADLILIGAPMYNFTISAPLKAWIDQIVRLNKTVAYGATGPVGLFAELKKTVVVVTSRGGTYSMTPSASNFDFQESYLRRILLFIGLGDVTFIHAENQMRGEQAAMALAEAMKRIGQWATSRPST